MSKLGLAINIMRATANSTRDFDATIKVARHAEALGYESVWTAEAVGTDCVVPLSFVAAHTERIGIGSAVMQMPARTPAMTAQTAVTLDKLSGGRFTLGLGASGAGVVEGWHSQPYGDAIERSREYVEIIRRVLSHRPVTYEGRHYQMPYLGPGATGNAKPVKLGMRPRARMPIILAAMGPKNLRLAADVADGTIMQLYSPYRERELFGDTYDRFGENKKSVYVNVAVRVADDTQEAIDSMKPYIAFWIGKMGNGGVNFYRSLAERLGFPEAVAVSDAFAQGDMKAAAAAVPDALVDETTLCGSVARIRDRIEAWRESKCTTMLVCGTPWEFLEPIADAVGV